MEKENIRFQGYVNDEIGLGRNRTEMTDDRIVGTSQLYKEPPITIEEEIVLEELGLGKNPPLRDIIAQDVKDDVNQE